MVSPDATIGNTNISRVNAVITEVIAGINSVTTIRQEQEYA
jgi:hypothetical protein